ncbi:hypothetical protein B0H19DRAFT_1297649 [Mycena capillaripes]|nr:hypothetical protein B0H19DRAFT_1297649 [Mycena capillaripes]
MPPSRSKDQSLHLGRLEQLSVTLRQVANRAANGSLEDLQTLCDSISHLPTSTTLRDLPAFYANLDPDLIPNMDSDAKPNTNVMECALAATEELYFLQNPGLSLPVAVSDIWPRYWAWIEFFQIYLTITTTEQRLPHLGLGEFELGSNVVQFMASFEDPTLCNLFGVTPGVRVLIARNWLLLVRREASAERDVGLGQVFKCTNGVGHLDASQPAGLAEFAEGAGGTINDLASLVVRTIAVLVPSRKPYIARRPLKFMGAILTFVVVTDNIVQGQEFRIYHQGVVENLLTYGVALSDCIACDNMTCTVMGDEAVFKRCIWNNHYCSKQCQITDWRTGHRSVCRVSLTVVDRKESAFIRALVHRDYELHKAGTIYPQQVRFMAQFPDSSFFTLFGYTAPSGRVRIEVQPVENLESTIREAWFDLLSRVRDSEGPMELHVMMDTIGTLVLPMRTINSSGVYDGMRRIAASLSPAVTSQADSVALLEAVQAVLDVKKDRFHAMH